ncbi:MAG: Uma2 family endonuclease [Lachnospiraceae bacterium]|nr:Uma2 family endonuclease [Lachnospiraceae bacterium]
MYRKTPDTGAGEKLAELDAGLDPRGSCELIGGHIVRNPAVGEDGRRLCFLIGTLLKDAAPESEIEFDARNVEADDENIFRLGIGLWESGREGCPSFAADIMPRHNIIYGCLDKAFALTCRGTAEYWIIDMAERFVYVFSRDISSGNNGTAYRRYSFDQTVKSSAVPRFSCSVSDVMRSDGGGLRQLAVFYRFREEILKDRNGQVAEDAGAYMADPEKKYTAEEFCEWMKVREGRARLADKAELFFGKLSIQEQPGFEYQFIRGNLYFSVRTFLKDTKAEGILCFPPIQAMLKKDGALDCVVSPDLFLVRDGSRLSGNLYSGVPDWIIEIATPRSAPLDYVDKAEIYAFHGVPEYWIVNPWKKETMVIKKAQESPQDVRVYSFDEDIPCGTLQGFRMMMRDAAESPEV